MKLKILLFFERVFLYSLVLAFCITVFFFKAFPSFFNRHSASFLFVLIGLLFCATGCAVDSIRMTLRDLIGVIKDIITITPGNLLKYSQGIKTSDEQAFIEYIK